MDRRTQFDQDADLKRYGGLEGQLQTVDLTDLVMARVVKLSSLTEKKRSRPMNRSAVFIAAAVFTLVASLTTYAASEYLQIRDVKGKVVMKTTKPADPLPTSYYSKLYSKYWDQANASVRQGQLLAYYMNDKVIHDYDQTPLHFTYKNDFAKYEDYVREMKAKEAPLLLEPEGLPKGYHYHNGQVVPAFPSQGDKDSSVYQDLLDKLKNQAQVAKGKEKLFTTVVPWTKSGSVTLIYKKDDTYLYFIATKGIMSEINQPEGAMVKQMNIKGQEVIYIRNGSYEPALNTLGWFDEKSHIAYHISDSSGSNLTEKDFVSMATSIIRQTQSAEL